MEASYALYPAGLVVCATALLAFHGRGDRRRTGIALVVVLLANGAALVLMVPAELYEERWIAGIALVISLAAVLHAAAESLYDRWWSWRARRRLDQAGTTDQADGGEAPEG